MGSELDLEKFGRRIPKRPGGLLFCNLTLPEGLPERPYRVLNETLFQPILRLCRSEGAMPLCRCVAISRLPIILQTGCDVQPSSSPIYAAMAPEKPLEYGDWPKVLEVFRNDKLKRTCVEVSADLEPNRLQEIAREYPTRVASEDGRKLWFSRLAPDDNRLMSGYEISYGWWIPGDPWEALVAVIVMSRSASERQKVIETLQSMLLQGE